MVACAALPAGARTAPAQTPAAPTLETGPGRVMLAIGGRRLVFVADSKGYVLATHVRDRGVWRPVYQTSRPLLAGTLFGDYPSSYRVLANTPRRVSVLFSGHHREPAYDWTLEVSASAGSPLFHFQVICNLPAPLTITSPQPTVALWTIGPDPAVQVDQGPDSIYGPAGIPHGYGFPAAYWWDSRVESAVFFDMTPMRWMRRSGVARFHDVRIMTRREGDSVGLGMHFKRLTGNALPAGPMQIDFYLYQGVRPDRPGKLAALGAMLRLFAPLHPASAPWPIDQVTGKPASWSYVARQTLAGLRTPGAMAEVNAPWIDSPLELVKPQAGMVVHPATEQPGSPQVAAGWDFSTVNNHLSPWLLLARLNGDAAALKVAESKVDALPRFYDPQSRLIRHGTRQPDHVGPLEMCWQNLFFHQEVLRASAAAGPGHFNPAVAGRFLMATAGLRELAANVNYLFPQWFDPYRKQPIKQNDMPQLGVVREPWQNGAYAYLMMAAYRMTGDRAHLAEARRCLDTLMDHMAYRVKGEAYDRTYSEPGEFPITELFGNAYGIAGAYQLYEATGDSKYLGYSRDFLDSLLVLTPWYEDETDPVSRDLHSAGLFFPHCGAHVVTPWETVEAHLMLAWVLKHDPANPLRHLLLRLANLNRTNSFYFYPAFWTAAIRAHDGANRSGPSMYFPVEPFYSLEGEGGHRGATAAYMAGLGLWNDWMFEALATTDVRDVMVLNLDTMDGYDTALAGLQRNFVVYNPAASGRSCMVRFSHLAGGKYLVDLGDRHLGMTSAQLAAGVRVKLPPDGDVRITIRRADAAPAMAKLKAQMQCQAALVRAYSALQSAGDATPEQVRGFRQAEAELQAGHASNAARLAAQCIKVAP